MKILLIVNVGILIIVVFKITWKRFIFPRLATYILSSGFNKFAREMNLRDDLSKEEIAAYKQQFIEMLRPTMNDLWKNKSEAFEEASDKFAEIIAKDVAQRQVQKLKRRCTT